MEITQDQLREIIKKYAKEIQKVVSEGTVGDYTWEGLLLHFQQEIEGSKRSYNLSIPRNTKGESTQ